MINMSNLGAGVYLEISVKTQRPQFFPHENISSLNIYQVLASASAKEAFINYVYKTLNFSDSPL